MTKMNKSSTPLPSSAPPEDTMDFSEAIREIIKGEHVTKIEWNNKDTYIYLRETLRIHFSDGKDVDLIVSDGDMLGMDWIITQ